jgi:hypothetical protein
VICMLAIIVDYVCPLIMMFGFRVVTVRERIQRARGVAILQGPRASR